MGNLGIQYTYAAEDRVEATMPVDHRTRQPFGILHGGASLALAETVAGLGSMILCQPDEIVVGMQVSGNHISSAHEGDTVRAVATIVHKGRSSHVWNVDVFTSTNKLVSSIRVVNSVMKNVVNPVYPDLSVNANLDNIEKSIRVVGIVLVAIGLSGFFGA